MHLDRFIGILECLNGEHEQNSKCASSPLKFTMFNTIQDSFELCSS